MGVDQHNGLEMYKDKPLKPKLPHNLLVLIGIVSANIIALSTFSIYFSGFKQQLSAGNPVQGVLASEHVMLQLNASHSDMLDVFRELIRVREELQRLREKTALVARRVASLAATPSDAGRDHEIERRQELERFDERVNQRVQEILAERTTTEEDVTDDSNPWGKWSKGQMSDELREFTALRKLPLGFNPALNSDSSVSSVGHACALQQADVDRFMSYEVGEDCPDDEALAQKLLLGGCEPLPRRRCFARKPWNYTDPVPFPDSLWTSPGDNNILWTAHPCKSFQCLNERAKHKVFADCLDCFDLEGREKHRWVDSPGDLDFSINEVLGIKSPGTIRIGLDIGGGTGSFAARMREHNVTIVTSTLNLNGPFNNFVAHRGLVPLFLTVSQRLPFFDNSLDIVHSMHVLSNWIPNESLEFLLYDIDRVLRPGGLFWLDHFFCVEPQLEIYVPMIERFGYIKHRWHIGEKLDRGAALKERYISALLEKPRGPRGGVGFP